MRKLLIVSILAFLAGCAKTPLPTPAPPKSAEVIVKASIIRITQVLNGREVSICTGMSIDSRKYLTAAHCVVDQHEYYEELLGSAVTIYLKGDNIMATVLKVDEARDLAVIMVDTVKPPVTFRMSPVELYEAVQAIGYGHGFTRPLITDHRLMFADEVLADDIWPGYVFSHPFVGGMSGGPVFDKNGKIVSIVQRSSDAIAYGVNMIDIMDFLTGHGTQTSPTKVSPLGKPAPGNWNFPIGR